LNNFFLPTPARPTKPEPRSISVAGSGTGEAPWPPLSTVSFVVPSDSVVVTDEVVSSESVTDTVEVEPSDDDPEVRLVLLNELDGSSDEGQPTIPKNIITTHKTINNFFILFLLIYYRKKI
jgi:hypothetical protein